MSAPAPVVTLYFVDPVPGVNVTPVVAVDSVVTVNVEPVKAVASTVFSAAAVVSKEVDTLSAFDPVTVKPVILSEYTVILFVPPDATAVELTVIDSWPATVTVALVVDVSVDAVPRLIDNESAVVSVAKEIVAELPPVPPPDSVNVVRVAGALVVTTDLASSTVSVAIVLPALIPVMSKGVVVEPIAPEIRSVSKPVMFFAWLVPVVAL
jgi:hypothetical protein